LDMNLRITKSRSEFKRVNTMVIHDRIDVNMSSEIACAKCFFEFFKGAVEER